MRKALLVLNMMIIISLVTVAVGTYLMVTHPFLSAASGILGINLVLLTMIKMA